MWGLRGAKKCAREGAYSRSCNTNEKGPSPHARDHCTPNSARPPADPCSWLRVRRERHHRGCGPHVPRPSLRRVWAQGAGRQGARQPESEMATSRPRYPDASAVRGATGPMPALRRSCRGGPLGGDGKPVHEAVRGPRCLPRSENGQDDGHQAHAHRLAHCGTARAEGRAPPSNQGRRRSRRPAHHRRRRAQLPAPP